jgi:hypothetical protein
MRVGVIGGGMIGEAIAGMPDLWTSGLVGDELDRQLDRARRARATPRRLEQQSVDRFAGGCSCGRAGCAVAA